MTNYNDGKIHGWNGQNNGKCPVNTKSVVSVWRRNGSCQTDLAGRFNWQHGLSSLDIIAFQVTKEHREPKTIWVNEYGEDNRGVAYYSKEEAKDHAKGCTRIAVKYQEMIE